MEASFIIGFHSARFDNLIQTLRFLYQYHTEVVEDSELITVCQDSCDLGKLQGWAHWRHFNLQLSCMHLPHVMNFGVDAANCEKLIILESDRVLPEGYFEKVLNQLEPGLQITTKKMLRPRQTLQDADVHDRTFEYNEEIRHESAEPGYRNMWSGNTAIMRSDFEKAGRMDEFYRGYGWADCDMTLTMEKAGVKSVYRPELEIHLWHEPATYGEGDQKQMFLDNGLYFLKKWNLPMPQFFREELAATKKHLI